LNEFPWDDILLGEKAQPTSPLKADMATSPSSTQ